MYHQRTSHLFFSNPPDWDELCQVTVTVPAAGSRPDKPKSLQPQVIKCRELIFTEPDIVATPSLDQENQITIVMQRSLFNSGKLHSRFHKMGIQADEATPVVPSEFQPSMNYTLLAKMASAWNKVGEYLIQGRDFLTNRHKINAVEYQLVINDSEMYVSLKAHVFRLPPLQLSDLDVPRPVVTEFLETRGKIEEYSIQKQWCHILPSMKKGQVVSVSHQLPPECPYKSYRELKRFWKNMYGYRLPEDDTGMLFYQVYFRPLGYTLYTYPECCLRPRTPVILPRPDDDTITRSFLSDLGSKMPSVCGRKLLFSNQPSFASTDLLDVDELKDIRNDNLHANLTDQRPSAWRPGVHLAVQQPQPPVRPSFASQSVAHRYSAPAPGPAPAVACQGDHTQQNMANTAAKLPAAADEPPGHLKSPAFQPTARTTFESQLSLSNNATTTEKIVPRFKPSFKCKPTFTPQSQRPNAGSEGRHVPSFQPTKSARSVGTGRSRDLPLLPSLQGAPEQVSGPPTGDIRKVPDQNNSAVRPTFTKRPAPATAPRFASKIPKPAPAVGFGFTKSPATSRKMASTPNLPRQKTHTLTNRPTTPNLASLSSSDSGLGSSFLESPSFVSSSTQKDGRSTDSQDFIAPTPSTPLSKRSLDAVSVPVPQADDVSFSRSAHHPHECENGTPVPKKPRAKPKLQENVDVEVLARTNKLGKVNSITLATWLKERGVACKSKDKKGELIEKALRVLNLLHAEQ